MAKQKLLTHKEVVTRGGNAIKEKVARGELPADYFAQIAKKGAKKRWPNRNKDHGKTKNN